MTYTLTVSFHPCFVTSREDVCWITWIGNQKILPHCCLFRSLCHFKGVCHLPLVGQALTSTVSEESDQHLLLNFRDNTTTRIFLKTLLCCDIALFMHWTMKAGISCHLFWQKLWSSSAFCNMSLAWGKLWHLLKYMYSRYDKLKLFQDSFNHGLNRRKTTV